MPSKKQNLIEVARSFSRKLNIGNYETADFFCSYKEETTPEKADEVSKNAFDFCRVQVEFDIEDYKKRGELKPMTKQQNIKAKQIWDEKKQENYNQDSKIEEINAEVQQATETQQ